MHSASRIRTWFILVGLCFSACATSRPDPLFARFADPPSDARPFVRWWWNGARVNEAEILRELDVMRAAGIGGVEINTIAMPEGLPPESLTAFPPRPWLGPAWLDAVKAAVAGARQRDMTPDIIVGSGWPFGGTFLSPAEQTQRVRLVKRSFTGPQSVQLTQNELFTAPADPARRRRGGDEVDPSHSKLVFLRLARANATTFDAGTDLMPTVAADGSARIEVPAGDFMLLSGVRDAGFTNVKLGAPGADGPVVNHFDAAAVRKYLDHMSAQLDPALGGSMGGATGLRATFVDSLELDHANWADDVPEEFKRRRGYDVMPYLPFVLDQDSVASGATQDTIRRARYDFLATLVELFEERFVATYVAWCEAHGVKARMQAYGRETQPLHGSMQVHLPEGETWLWHDNENQRAIWIESAVVNKYVSSAAHLTGQRRMSFEAMTNAVPVFCETLDNFKEGLDLTLMAGLNHPIIHGFNYTPPEAGFPGWVRFGSYLNERTPFWPRFRDFSDYAARVGEALRGTEAVANIAVLAPRADEWARFGLLYQPFPEVHHPWYQYKWVEAVHQAGYAADFVSERILQKATVANGQLHFGPRAFDLLVLQDVESLEPATAEALASFARGGGRVLILGQTPIRAPGLADAQKNDSLVTSALAAAKAAGAGRVWELPAPVQPEETRAARLRNPTAASRAAEGTVLLAHARDVLARTGVAPAVAFETPLTHLSQVRHRADDGRTLVLFANHSRSEEAAFTAQVPGTTGKPWRWDPESGTRSPYPMGADGRIQARLHPLGSLLLVWERDADPRGAAERPGNGRLAWDGDAAPLGPGVVVAGAWQVSLERAAQLGTETRVLPELVDLSLQAQDPALATFGGTAIYKRTVTITDPGEGILDLGAVYGTSEVFINGTRLGSRWHGPHIYDARSLFKMGSNQIEIRVATVLANHMKAHPEIPMAKRWAGWFKPIPTGLAGPVRLVRAQP